MEPGEADLFDAARAARWLPVDLMIGGADQVRSCFFHVRMIAKALKALGFSDVDEPVAELLPIGMVQTAGVKMSKSAGNMVGLDDLLAAHGCDAVRFAVLSAAAPERDFNWTDTLIQRAERFLAAVGRLAGNPSLGAPPPSGAGQGAAVDPGGWRTRLAGWIATGAHKITQNLSRHEFHLAGRNLEFLLDRLQQFERATRGAAAPDDARALREAWEVFVRLLAPTAPHLAEALWAQLGHPPFVAAADWPVAADRPPPRGVERAPEAVA
jgi:leucyl-tRNA synthetase